MRERSCRGIRWKLMLTLILCIPVSACLGMLLERLLRGGAEVLFLWGAGHLFGLGTESAQAMLNLWFGEHRLLLRLCQTAVLLVCFYFAAGETARNLRQISGAIRQVSQQTGEEVRLPLALRGLESDLNALRTELEQREEDVREAERRRQELVSFLAHDLKTPLTSVVGYLTLLRDDPSLTPEQRAKFTGVALEKAGRLEELLSEFFDISRMELTGGAVESSPIQLTVLLEQLSDEFYPIFAEQGLRYRVDIAAGLTVMGDADRLVRVFDNVLRNAVHYSIPGGEVEVRALRKGENAEVIISNEGLEIPEGELSNVFEKFYRLDAARSSHTGGAGLGLAIAKEIVEHHGGTIHCESDGRWTRFHISLPLLREPRGR